MGRQKLTKSGHIVEKKTPEAKMRRQKLTISWKKPAGGQNVTPKLQKKHKTHHKNKKNIPPQKKKRNFNENKNLSISLIIVFHTDSEFRSPNPVFF